jgi:hypothetical protein
LRPGTAERCWAALPAALLLAVAGGQLVLANTASLSPWKGGGFGMFASLDARPFRHVRIFVAAPERSEELDVLATSVEILPSDYQLEQLARGVVARERRHRRPVTDVRVELWRVEFASGSLAPHDRLVRTYAFHAVP